jgi:cysteine protease ATG4
MANNEFARFSRKVVQYFWDPLPRNEDPSPIWCLGRSYDSRYQDTRKPAAPGTSPSNQSDSSTSQADSAVVTDPPAKPAQEEEDVSLEALAKSQADLTRSEEESLGWPPEFLDDLESRVWMTYRSSFPPIAKSSDPAAGSGMSFATKLRSLANQGFSSDTGWGCMIRSGQSLLANTLCTLELGREWRRGDDAEKERKILGMFADSPEAPFSIHKFVEHGAQACGKHPGEWFGPSAAARCLQ